MIVSELTGGAGNQMFQYAAGFATARRARTALRLDLRHYDAETPVALPDRPYRLDRFDISARPLSKTDTLRVEVSLDALSPTRRRRVLSRLFPGSLKLLVDRAEGDDLRLHAPPRNAYLRGCWQTEKLFADMRGELLREFTFRAPMNVRNAALAEEMQRQPAVAVHFRRTDYLSETRRTDPCSLEYYDRAFNVMKGWAPNARYFVFSDDPCWVIANSRLPERSTLISHNVGVDDIEDMRLMSLCDHFIIANSTFSWWGAWLSARRDKRVIAPAVWYERGHGSEPDLVPQSWARLVS